MSRGAVIVTTLILDVGMGSLAGSDGRSRTTRGGISSVDAGTKGIKVKERNDEVAFRLESSANVMENNTAATFANLKPCEHVRVRYTGAETDRPALEVEILAQAPAATGQVQVPE